MDLPYRAEYAKSGSSNCRGCKSPIGQGTVRLAVMVQSPFHDGMMPNWHHLHCFFNKQRPKSEDDIYHFETLRLEDQEIIREKLSNMGSIIVPEKKGKGKKRDATAIAQKNAALKDFKIEYAKSGRAACRGCEQKILKDEIRISKKDFETDIGKKYGGQDMWHHVTCFAQLRAELGYFESADQLPGFKSLKKEDQAETKKALPAIKQEDVPDVKKVKKEEDVVDGFTEEQSKLYKEQTELIFKHRDQLEKNLSKEELAMLLQHNDQEVPPGKDRVLDRLADIMTFGALVPCSVCKHGQLVFEKFGYICKGNLTEYTKCRTQVKEPPRKPFKVPAELKQYPFLKKYKYVPRTRVVKNAPPSYSVKKEEGEENAEPKVKREAPALYNMEFVILGQPDMGKEELKRRIVKLGGKVVTKISGTVMAVFASKADVEKMGARMKVVQEEKIHVVSEDFIEEAPQHKGKIPELVISKSICDWGSDPTTRLPPERSSSKSKSGSIYTKSMPSKVKLTVKGGSAVDPDSGLEHKAHVYTTEHNKYFAVLSKTDIQTNKNSYYKLQLLEADAGNKYWIFRSWGRIGTTIGGNKLEQFYHLHDALLEFHKQYEEKTGNRWENRFEFQKIPGLFCPVDVDFGDVDEDQSKSMDITDSASTLPLPIQNLIRKIFDVKAMQKLMLEFELDTEKMPLGKLSKKQISKAYAVLAELQQLVDTGGAEAMLVDASNRFYTFIPHSFGVDNPPTLNDAETIKKKIEMLDSLMELEIAYNLMKSSGSEHTVDSYYKQLNTEIDVLKTDSEEYKIIQEYVTNTHAATHGGYSLNIKNVFTIKRQGEDKRFRPFKKLHNHKLLWHGSRTTNFAGILSQGLRIAPPEAPVTGYMFGKGIYFADMGSKSANYCCTSVQNPTGLLLLCDVALGNTYERNPAEYVEKLPKGKHRSKGLGRTEPDPKASKTLDGIEVPLGKGVTNDNMRSALLYNGYIVFDVAQVNVKYLVEVDFKYKY
uniref:Poly-(ADP-ribose) polymerase n=1 Tax=Tribolium castaneum TaxID=7070 RepID=UPI003134487B